MHINDEAVIATSFIGKDGDEKNQCFLSKESLFVQYRGRIERFSLDNIVDIQFKHKLILFPLITGGIIAPLCLLAILNDLGNPWALLSGMVAGLLMTYYGYEGTPSLSVTSKVKEYDFFIRKPTPNLKAFIKYVRQIYMFGPDGYYFYLDNVPPIVDGAYEFEDDKKLLYYEEILKLDKPLYRIDPQDVNKNFQLIPEDNMLNPMLSGKINAEYIVSVDS